MRTQESGSDLLTRVMVKGEEPSSEFIKEVARLPINEFVEMMLSAIKRSSDTKRQILDGVRHQLCTKFVSKFSAQLMPFGQALTSATLVHRGEIKSLIQDVHKICYSIENNAPSEEVKILFRISPFNEIVASCQNIYGNQDSQSDDPSAVTKVQVEALIQTVTFLQGQLTNFQQIVIFMNEEINSLKEKNSILNEKINSSSFKYVNILELNENERTNNKNKRKRENPNNEQEEKTNSEDGVAQTCELAASSSGMVMTTFSEALKRVNHADKQSNNYLGTPARADSEQWRFQAKNKKTNTINKSSAIIKTPGNNVNNALKNSNDTKLKPKTKYQNKNLIIGNKSTQELKSALVEKWFYTGRWDMNTKLIDVESHIKSFVENKIEIAELDTTKHNKFKSFKFKCDIKFKDAILTADNWPVGIAIGKYYNGSSHRVVNDRDIANNPNREGNVDLEKAPNIGVSNAKLPANPLINSSTQSTGSGNPELMDQ